MGIPHVRHAEGTGSGGFLLQIVNFCVGGLEHAVAVLRDRPSTGEAGAPDAGRTSKTA